MDGACAAPAAMCRNNVYYCFTNSVNDDEYATLRANRHMNVMAHPGCDKVTFKLASLTVSAINGGATCMNSHEKTLRKHDLGAQAVQSALRIASIVHASAFILEQAEARQVA